MSSLPLGPWSSRDNPRVGGPKLYRCAQRPRWATMRTAAHRSPPHVRRLVPPKVQARPSPGRAAEGKPNGIADQPARRGDAARDARGAQTRARSVLPTPPPSHEPRRFTHDEMDLDRHFRSLGCPVSARKAVIAGTLAAALLGIGADQAAASYTGRVQDDTLTLSGNAASDKLALQIVSPTELVADVGEDGTIDFTFDRTQYAAV